METPIISLRSRTDSQTLQNYKGNVITSTQWHWMLQQENWSSWRNIRRELENVKKPVQSMDGEGFNLVLSVVLFALAICIFSCHVSKSSLVRSDPLEKSKTFVFRILHDQAAVEIKKLVILHFNFQLKTNLQQN
jgi:hypothetical protein